MSHRQHERILLLFGQFQKFLCQGPRLEHAATHDLCVGQAGKRREQLRSATDLSR